MLRARRGQRTVALKLLRQADAKHVTRFEQEGRILSQLQHPNLPQVLELGREGGLPFLAMEFVEGEDLSRFTDRVGVPPVTWTANTLQPVAHALQRCHEHGVIHRDVKPANVVLERGTQRPVLVDFGLLKRVDRTIDLRSLEDAAALLTRTGEIRGTPATMAPEQISADRHGPVSARTDVYGLGATLFQLLTGESVFEGASLAALLGQILAGDPPDPAELNPQIPPALSALCLRCLAKDPAERPASALDMAHQLADAAGVARLPYAPATPTPGDDLPSTAPSPVLAPQLRQPRVAGTPEAIGPYAILGELGRGGMGAVYRARDATGREVALKVASRPEREVTRERFTREGVLTAALDHPGIVRVHAAGEHDGVLTIAYELVEGARSLDQANEGLEVHDRIARVRDAARALGHAHAQGIVHRDVKPDNLLVDAAGQVKVADFGLATARDLDRLTRTGAYVGTPLYMAPEQIGGKELEPTPATDVWALGVVLYQCLCGELPFRGQTPLEQMALIGDSDANLILPSRRATGVPADLDGVLKKTLRSDPALRYPDAEALAADLDRYLAGEAPLAAPPAGSRAGAVVAALLLALVGVGVGVAFSTGRTKPERGSSETADPGSDGDDLQRDPNPTPNPAPTLSEARAAARTLEEPLTRAEARAFAERFGELPEARRLLLETSLLAGPLRLSGSTRSSTTHLRFIDGALVTFVGNSRVDGIRRWDLEAGLVDEPPRSARLLCVPEPLLVSGGAYLASVRGRLEGDLDRKIFLTPYGDTVDPQPLPVPPLPERAARRLDGYLRCMASHGDDLILGYYNGWLQHLRRSGKALELIRAWQAHPDPIKRVGFTAEGTLISTGGVTGELTDGVSRGQICAWDLSSDEPLDQVLLPGEASLLGISPSDGATFAVGVQAAYLVRVYRLSPSGFELLNDLQGSNTRERYATYTISGFNSPPRSGAFSADGRFLFVGGGNSDTNRGELRAYELPSGQEVAARENLHCECVDSLAVSPDGAALVLSAEIEERSHVDVLWIDRPRER